MRINNTQNTSFKQNLLFKFPQGYEGGDIKSLVLIATEKAKLGIDKPIIASPIIVGNEVLVLDETTTTGKMLNLLHSFVNTMQTAKSPNLTSVEKLFADEVYLVANNPKETKPISFELFSLLWNPAKNAIEKNEPKPAKKALLAKR